MTSTRNDSNVLASSALRRQVVDHYERQLEKHGPSARGMDWKDSESQRLRFELLTSGFELSGASVHDVGSGVGHFLDFLLDRDLDVDYSGSDLSADMIAASRERHPSAKFFERDVLDGTAKDRYDFVFCSGLFNVRLDCPDAPWQKFIENTVQRMFEMCDRAIAFNLMTNRVDFRAPELFYSDPDEMRDFCLRMSPDVSIFDDYPLYEYTVHVIR